MSTDTPVDIDELATRTRARSLEERAKKEAEARDQEEIARGDIQLFALEADREEVIKVRDNLVTGKLAVTDDESTKLLERAAEALAEKDENIVRLNEQIEELKEQVKTARSARRDGKFVLTFDNKKEMEDAQRKLNADPGNTLVLKSEDEKKKAEAVLRLVTTDDGAIVDPRMVEKIFQEGQKHLMPIKPPTATADDDPDDDPDDKSEPKKPRFPTTTKILKRIVDGPEPKTKS